MNGCVAGLVSFGLGNMNGVSKVVIASLIASLELGMLLLAIATLFIPRRSSALVERLVTWVSTSTRRLTRSIVTKRWGCLGGGLVLVAGLGRDEYDWHLVRTGVGNTGRSNMDTSVLIWLTVGPFFALVMKIHANISKL